MESINTSYLKEMGVTVWRSRQADALLSEGIASANSGIIPEDNNVIPADNNVIPALSRDLVNDGDPGHFATQNSGMTSEKATQNSGMTSEKATQNSRMTGDWENLRNEALACTACELHKSRSHVVFGVGNQTADLMIIGEAPGYYEDKQGEPFVGRAGQLLNAMLQAIDLDRESVYIANILKCRPPNNRDPLPEEVSLCTKFLTQQIALIQPKAICAVGRIAAQFLLDTQLSLGKLRHKEHQYGESKTPMFVTYHPAYLLRNPAAKSKAYQDLLLVKQLLSVD